MDPLQSAKRNAEKIQELREELDRLRGIIFASQGIAGKLLDEELIRDSTGQLTDPPQKLSD